jgi:serine/threonine protein kinase
MDTGLRIADRYLIKELIRQTRRTQIHLAADLALGIDVEIKTIHPKLLRRDPSFGEVLHREASLGSKLDHPNIRRIYHAGACDLGEYLVMEHLEGCPLSEFVSRLEDERCHAAVFVALATQMAAALEYMHQRGLYLNNLVVEGIAVNAASLRIQLIDLGWATEGPLGSKTAHEQPACGASPKDAWLAAQKFRQARAILEAGPKLALKRSKFGHEMSYRYRDYSLNYQAEIPSTSRDIAAMGRVFCEMRGAQNILDHWMIYDLSSQSFGGTIHNELDRLLMDCLTAEHHHRLTSAGEVRRRLESLGSVAESPASRSFDQRCSTTTV